MAPSLSRISAARRFAAVAIAGVLLGSATVARAQEPLKIRIGWSVAPAQLTPILFAHAGLARHLGQSYTLEPVRFTLLCHSAGACCR